MTLRQKHVSALARAVREAASLRGIYMPGRPERVEFEKFIATAQEAAKLVRAEFRSKQARKAEDGPK